MICENCKCELTEQDNRNLKCGNCKKLYDLDYYVNNMDEIPDNVRGILEDIGDDYDYTDLQNVLDKIEPLGWTYDYGLDCEPMNLKPINEPQKMLN